MIKMENTSRRSPAPTRAMPASDSMAAVVTLLEPAKPEGPRNVKLPGKVPPVKLKVRVKVVPVVGVPATNLSEGFPITTRTRPTPIRATLRTSNLLTTPVYT